jgi:HlyD family secretion protein
MDIPRPERALEKRRKRIAWGIAAALGVLLITLGLSRLKPAAPSVDKATVWIDSVKRGEMLRQVRGLGTLVPEEIRWIPAATEGRVERRVLEPGVRVEPDSVILELSNPEVERQALDASAALRAAEARLAELRVRLERERLDQEASVARVEAEQQQAKLRAERDQQLFEQGLLADINNRLSQVTAGELGKRLEIERERLAILGDSIAAQLRVQDAEVDQARALAQLRWSQREGLRVKAGIGGVLQQVPIEVGQQVSPGTNLARVARPEKLKAVIRIAETQARDVQIGQQATVDTRNGVIPGHVARIDPAVQNGTVTVDVALDGELPKGARPDLTVDGTIELERLDNVLYVGRPAQVQAEGTAGLFRLEADGTHASRVRVELGRASVSTIEVVGGLQEGDQVILSDTSAWDAFERIRLD